MAKGAQHVHLGPRIARLRVHEGQHEGVGAAVERGPPQPLAEAGQRFVARRFQGVHQGFEDGGLRGAPTLNRIRGLLSELCIVLPLKARPAGEST